MKAFQFAIILLCALMFLLEFGRVNSKQNSICQNLPSVNIFGYEGSLSDLENGYCIDGYYIPGLITNSFFYTQPPQFFASRALYQEKGLLELSASEAGLSDDDVEGFIASCSPSTLGWKAYIRLDNESEWIPVRQADSVKREHYYFHAYWNLSCLELNYDLAERLGIVNHVNEDGTRYKFGVQVCFSNENPEEICQGEPTDMTEWFKENVRFVGDLNLSSVLASR